MPEVGFWHARMMQTAFVFQTKFFNVKSWCVSLKKKTFYICLFGLYSHDCVVIVVDTNSPTSSTNIIYLFLSYDVEVRIRLIFKWRFIRIVADFFEVFRPILYECLIITALFFYHVPEHHNASRISGQTCDGVHWIGIALYRLHYNVVPRCIFPLKPVVFLLSVECWISI